MTEQDSGKWVSCMVKCGICSKEHMSVHPLEIDGCGLECSGCGMMACYPVDDSLSDNWVANQIEFNKAGYSGD